MAKLAITLAALAACCAGAHGADPKESAAVDKVLQMMEENELKVKAEGEAESSTFFKFETFCNDTEDEKDTAITANKDEKASLEADIKLWESDNAATARSIEELETDIPALEQQIKSETAARMNESADYKKSNGEIETAVVAVGKAIDEMKASQTSSSFIQRGVKKTVHAAILLARSLGLKTAKAIDVNSVEEADSSYDGIIDILEDLQTQFRTTDQDSDMDEAKAAASWKLTHQALKSQLETKKKELEDAKQEKATKEARIAKAKQDVASIETTLADDEKYLAEVKEMREEKKLTFQQRTAMRAEELEAIGQAKDILQAAMAPAKAEADAAGPSKQAAAGPSKQAVAGPSKQANPALIEVASHAPRLLTAAAAEAAAIERAEAKPKVAFLQRRDDHKPRQSQQAQKLEADSTEPEREQLVALLTSSASKLHSQKLAMLAQKATADPFKAVRDLISGLISKLQKQASEAQTKKAYCDQEIGKAEQVRGEASSKVTELNRLLASNEARRDQLAEDAAALTASLLSLGKQKAQASELRANESQQSVAEVSEAEDAVEGVKQAIQVLSDFYAKGKDAKVEAPAPKKAASLLQQSPAADAPDAGFEGGEAYQGDQASSGGIIGLLEVIQGKFERSISEAKALEEEAKKEHAKLLDDIAVSTTEKEKSKELKMHFKTETLEEISQQTSALERASTSMKSALLELSALEEQCGIGASYDKRKAAREEEMKTLQEAIQMFDQLLSR